MDINKNSPIPLYYQLAEAIREQIASGELKPGDQLPTERELTETTGISRVTVRQALGYLTREGLLIAHHGKGTFVAEPKLSYEAFHLLGFTEKMMSQGMLTSSRVIEQKVITPPKSVAARLHLGRSERAIKVVRLRLSQQVPLLLETVYLPHRLCAGLEQENLMGKSMYALLEEQYGLRLQYAHQSLEATVANDYEAEVFGVAAGTPMILLEGVTFSSQEQRVEYFKAVYRGDRFRFEFESPRNLYSNGVSHTQLVKLVLDGQTA